MKFTCGLTLTLPLLLVLLLVVATKGHTVLQCYVCDNCEKVNAKLTPLEQCGGENFSTTTPGASTSMSPGESTTKTTSSSVSENLPTTTAMPPKSSTARPSTEDPETTNSTIELITLSTNSLISSTTPSSVDDTNATSSTSTPTVFVTPTEESSTTTTSATTTTSSTESDLVIPSENITWAFPLGNLSEVSLNRQRRHTEFNGITYYCYKIQKRYDNVFGTKRGCIGVKTNERPVCDELNMANNNQTKKCSTCTTTMCNGSSTIGVSIATLLVALLALIYKV